MEHETQQTPLMQQYWGLKKEANDALLFFRMGDFYELFGEDAIEASKLLDITLTSRDKNKENPMPMAGVPHHSAESYIQKILHSGRKVAIGEQTESPSSAKGLVKREIVRVFTPAIHFESGNDDARYLAAITTASSPQSKQKFYTLSCLDPSTGQLLISEELTLEKLKAELSLLPIFHFLLLEKYTELGLSSHFPKKSVLIEKIPNNYLHEEQAQKLFQSHFQSQNLNAFFQNNSQIYAAGILLNYTLRSQQKTVLLHLKKPTSLRNSKNLQLGPHTPEHLDLISEQENKPNLYHFLNRTQTSCGARELKRWLLSPLTDPESIRIRQEAIQTLFKENAHLKRFQKLLSEIYDLERIMGRISTGLASPKDTFALGKSLLALSGIVDLLKTLKTTRLKELSESLTEEQLKLIPLTNEVLSAQLDAPPHTVRDGKIFQRGYHKELDHLIDLTEKGEQWLIELETKEKKETGITKLKVRYNRVFGYYIEVTKGQLNLVPQHYQRKQSTVNSERFFTEELKKFEEEIITADAKRKALEASLFEKLIETIQSYSTSIMSVAQNIAELDVYTALAELLFLSGWTFPTIDESLILKIQAGRHPLVDEAQRGSFVPNDTKLNPPEKSLMLITGPNMGGKSTVMRQVALMIILGQMGAPIPAIKAHWGFFSSIYTRIGAHDAIAQGQSTFMVEMSELAHLLHHGDERSLIILDEIGRGTSTYDGMSVAWATIEWIVKKLKARTLFATHYHELIDLEKFHPTITNTHMAVDESRSQKLRFLYELRSGPTNESFGIHVAELAGLPRPVITRAWKILEHLEKNSSRSLGESNFKNSQLSLFDSCFIEKKDPSNDNEELEPFPHKNINFNPALIEIETELHEIDPNQLTPLEALNVLSVLKKKLEN